MWRWGMWSSPRIVLCVGRDWDATPPGRAAGASSSTAPRRKTLSREALGDMQCRKLDAPAPRREVDHPPKAGNETRRNLTQLRLLLTMAPPIAPGCLS